VSGVSNPVIRADHLDTPLSYEAMEAIGSGLGTAAFIVFDD
jgi:NADH-quinone oxidoreductase subunit F